MNQLRCQHESGEGFINYGMIEIQEQLDAAAFILPDDVVLELGARWGGVSIVINSQLKDKTKHLAVEPDKRVWEVLEKNRDNHNCHFHIVISVDTEGSELKILQSLDHQRYDVRYITCEHNYDENKRKQIREYLESVGYKFYEQNSWDDIFVK